MLLLEQSKNEQLLYDYLCAHGKDVLWNSEVQSFSQTETGVTAQVKTAGLEAHTIEAKFLVGCDGARSPVRQALGMDFTGSTFERIFYVADTQVDWKFSHDALHICLSKDSLLLFLPLKGDKRYRIVGTFPEEFAKDEGEILYEEIEQRMNEQAQLALDIHDVEWFSTYKVHARHVSSFSYGRCFLAGDAAHIHSPAGAQGMNTGIQDVYNLAWKMALTLKRNANASLLDTYNEERLENARNLLQTTDRLFQFGAGSMWPLAFLRMNVFPYVAKFILSVDAIKKIIFPRISQIGITYRHSSLSEHSGDADLAVKAGDRLPYFLVEGTSIYDRLREPRFHFMAFSNDGAPPSALTETISSQSSGLVDFHTVPLTAAISEIFECEESFSLLLRPDNYIGLISRNLLAEDITAYLRHVIGA